MKKYAKFSLYLALILITTLSVHAEEENFSLIDQLPSHSLLVAHWPDIPQTIDAFQKTSLYQLFKDPEVKMFIDSMYDVAKPQVEGMLQQAEQQFGISLQDALNIFQGEVTLALVDVNFQQKKLGIAATINFGENGETVNKAIELLKQMTQITFSTTTYENTEILVLDQAPPKMKVCYAILHNSLVICSSQELMQQLIAGQSDKLVDSANFKTVLSKVFPEGSVPSKMIYVNVEQALQQFSPMIPPQAQQIGGMLGFMNIKSIAAGGSISGQRIGSAMFLHCEDKKGVMSLLDFGGIAEENVQKIPHHSISASLVHADYDELFRKVEAVLQEIDPNGGLLAQYKQGSEQLQQMLGFSLQDELFASMGTDHYSFAYMPQEGGLLPRGVSAVQLKDINKFMEVLNKICASLGVDIESTDANGTKLSYFSVPLGKFGEDPFKDLERNPVQGFFVGLGLGLSGMAFFVENNYMYMTANVHDAKDFLTNRSNWTKSIATHEDFVSAKKHVPQGSSFVLYTDLRKPFCGIWNTVTPVVRPFDGFIRSLGIPFDSALVPRAVTISRYLTPGTLSYTCDQHGMLLSSNGTLEATLPLVGVAAVGITAAIAVPAVLRARLKANEASAIATLRTISSSQAMFQSSAVLDQNENGTGEYGFLQELSGQQNLRGKNHTIPSAYLATMNFRDGIAEKSGYYFYCYLPGSNGTAVGEKDASSATGDDATLLQENGFVVYAWPIRYGNTGERVFAINQSGEVISCYTSSYSRWNIPKADAAYADAKDSSNLQGKFSVNDMGQDGNYWYSLYE
ncbi:DUF3352 domain-containing protein [Candidatus Uabimicrobium amorphum]|uniref:Uncharacterized protein n=1 Tax=Uabimicrobium amorphum TaxID=2596890 RepID=A0A5S9IQZ6_UABAM|nr:DUF3352 domain-containing protein [Candidatus Uabimicrobium amorphum]BBM86026.1 hypothetical protein UABAM_04412 [Candidatus Uabimicrobium amorphum]